VGAEEFSADKAKFDAKFEVSLATKLDGINTYCIYGR